MEEKNLYGEPKQNGPKDLIGMGGKKEDDSAQKVVVSNEMPIGNDDPYDGYLRKTNFVVFVGLILSIAAFVLGMILMIYQIIRMSSGTSLTFERIKTGVYLLAFGFVGMVGLGYARTVVEKKRRSAYSSKHTNKTFEQFKVKEHEAEGAKRGMSTSESTLDVSESKEDFKYCLHCHARIPKSSGMFCPKCGKRQNSAPMHD